MKTAKNAIPYILLLLLSLALFGCGQKADENKPLNEVQAEAEKMNTSQLRSMAMDYKKAITAKEEEIKKLTAQLKEIPVTKMLGDEAKEIKAEMDNIKNSASALQKRFEVYYNKLKEKGGDTSGL